ncbi:MAG: DUF1822 family protein [Moorea sp. SIOASIH]|uniref:DUF1822 family protein n=1 Tax=Moorena sp. SIOASIH TaxID=2607817 RepID=UPI0013B750A0|nr:DUF1822 family protein [Moorena sp. SIOASIH]NEO39557.1 DUF1822 family protein [Moorena sp. SIOASIH]
MDSCPYPVRVSRGKVIDWAIQNYGQAVVLVMELISTTPEKVEIYLQLYPARNSTYLPPGLQVVVLNKSETSCMEEEARSADYWLQLHFDVQLTERFSVRLALGYTSITKAMQRRQRGFPP